ncbi:MAG TPA: VacJ family lipoprotein [Azospirillaceae bacterium]|nr:VacJ family lipoprotein [Azospirillaceae bacterium]
MKLATLIRPFATRRATRLAGAALVALSLGACALPPSDPVGREAYWEANDPFEGVNRAVFGLNEGTDILVIRPAAEIYRGVVPSPVRDAVRNFLRNLASPIVIANQLLQGDMKGVSVAVRRFLINTTVGVGGLVDVAEREGLPYESEDFGQTLAVWGVPEGPYVVLPLLGPSSVRDSVGLAADTAADPVRIVANHNEADDVLIGRAAASGVDTRARLIEPVDDLRKNSLDYYAAVRSLYRQRREADITDRKAAAIPQ